MFITAFAYASEIESYLKELRDDVKSQESGFKGFDAKRGERIFFSEHIGKRGKKVSCASCHTRDLRREGENIFTGKKIKPLSPKVNPERLTNLKKVKKWLRRNFRDVYRKDGTAKERGDVLTFIINFKEDR
jgi:cytochrome c peroxidase